VKVWSLEERRKYYEENKIIDSQTTLSDDEKHRELFGDLNSVLALYPVPEKLIEILCHEKTGRQISRYEHQIVMEEILGRELFEHERIHHKNGVRDDNRRENLELWSISQPPGQRVEDKLEHYIEFVRQYGYKVSKE
jgi:hypothetical protein